MRSRRLVVLVVLGALLVAAPAAARQEGDPVVRGVLFFSPNCGHCEYVIQEVLPPLYEEHGGPWELHYDESLVDTGVAFYLLTNGTLELLLVDVTVADGSRFFQVATETMSIGSGGVPRLIVGNQVMIGSTGIPERFPGLIVDGLDSGGIGWPDLPGIEAIVGSIPVPIPTTTSVATTTTSAASTTTSTTAPSTTTSVVSGAFPPSSTGGFVDDPLANTLAVVVLIGLAASLVAAVVMIRGTETAARPGVAVPALVVAGLAVAGYLAYVETASVDAVCGPLGNCNAVQQSEYAQVFGMPIGIIGVVGYSALGALWLVQRRAAARRADMARVGMAAIAVGGVAFSAYLTFLEPFVIGATCAWCLASAVVIGAILWLTVPAGVSAWRRLAARSGSEELAA